MVVTRLSLKGKEGQLCKERVKRDVRGWWGRVHHQWLEDLKDVRAVRVGGGATWPAPGVLRGGRAVSRGSEGAT